MAFQTSNLEVEVLTNYETNEANNKTTKRAHAKTEYKQVACEQDACLCEGTSCLISCSTSVKKTITAEAWTIHHTTLARSDRKQCN